VPKLLLLSPSRQLAGAARLDCREWQQGSPGCFQSTVGVTTALLDWMGGYGCSRLQSGTCPYQHPTEDRGRDLTEANICVKWLNSQCHQPLCPFFHAGRQDVEQWIVANDQTVLSQTKSHNREADTQVSFGPRDLCRDWMGGWGCTELEICRCPHLHPTHEHGLDLVERNTCDQWQYSSSGCTEYLCYQQHAPRQVVERWIIENDSHTNQQAPRVGDGNGEGKQPAFGPQEQCWQWMWGHGCSRLPRGRCHLNHPKHVRGRDLIEGNICQTYKQGGHCFNCLRLHVSRRTVEGWIMRNDEREAQAHTTSHNRAQGCQTSGWRDVFSDQNVFHAWATDHNFATNGIRQAEAIGQLLHLRSVATGITWPCWVSMDACLRRHEKLPRSPHHLARSGLLAVESVLAGRTHCGTFTASRLLRSLQLMGFWDAAEVLRRRMGSTQLSGSDLMWIYNGLHAMSDPASETGYFSLNWQQGDYDPQHAPAVVCLETGQLSGSRHGLLHHGCIFLQPHATTSFVGAFWFAHATSETLRLGMWHHFHHVQADVIEYRVLAMIGLG